MNGKPRGPHVPRSAEEEEAEREDAARAAEEHRQMVERARRSGRLLVMSAAGVSALAVLVAAVVAPTLLAFGLAAGCVVMTANLFILARLLAVLLLEDGNKAGSATLLFLSFLALGGVSVALIRHYPDQDFIMGFGLGLAVPAVAGMLWSLFRRGG